MIVVVNCGQIRWIGWTWRLSNISWTGTACLLSYPQLKTVEGATSSYCTSNMYCCHLVRNKGVHLQTGAVGN